MQEAIFVAAGEHACLDCLHYALQVIDFLLRCNVIVLSVCGVRVKRWVGHIVGVLVVVVVVAVQD